MDLQTKEADMWTKYIFLYFKEKLYYAVKLIQIFFVPIRFKPIFLSVWAISRRESCAWSISRIGCIFMGDNLERKTRVATVEFQLKCEETVYKKIIRKKILISNRCSSNYKIIKTRGVLKVKFVYNLQIESPNKIEIFNIYS